MQDDCLHRAATQAFTNASKRRAFIMAGANASRSLERYLDQPKVQFSSVAQSCPTLCDTMDCSMPGLHVHNQLPELLKLIQPSHPLSFSSPSTFNLSQHQVFSSESVLHIGWPKHWSFSFSISPSNKYSTLISFRMDWLDLLSVQGTLKSLLQHHSS